MHKRLNRAQRNYIIAGLCMILVIMAVGYAAFASQLKISGTSNISSNFLVRITDIQSTVLNGQASDAQTPTHTETTATFKTNLVSPGDAMRYDITVANEGSIDAVLNSIDVNTGENDAITFETSGIKEGDALLKSTTDVLTVIVRYNSSVTSQPESTESTITVTLNYGQSDGTALPGVDGPLIGGQEVELVESGDGLYEDSYEAGRYIYRGNDPDNYITFNDELWRIVAKETDGTYKIIRNDVVTFDELGVTDGLSYSALPYDARNHRTTQNNSYCDDPNYGCGVFAAVSGTFRTPSGSKQGTVTEDSTIKKILNEGYSEDELSISSYYSTLSSTAKGQMTSHTFNIGAVEYLDESGAEADSIEKNIAGEKMYTWTGNVGLANVSDILKASINPSCTSASKVMNEIMSVSGPEDFSNPCSSNYLLFDLTDPTGFWTINAFGSESGSIDGYSGSTLAWNAGLFGGAGNVVGGDASYVGAGGARPVLYLKSDITLIGEGTEVNPFQIS